jgi:hypothetical protein
MTMLVRARPALRPDLRYVPKLLLAAGLGGACILLPVPDAVAAVLAAGVYAGVALLLRVVPEELLVALLRRRAAAPAQADSLPGR